MPGQTGGEERRKKKRDMQLFINNNKKATINANVFFSPALNLNRTRATTGGEGQETGNPMKTEPRETNYTQHGSCGSTL
jgi:hypothetical protein